MNRKQIEQTAKEILADKLDINVKTIRMDSDFIDDLRIDSFMAVELAFEIREKFGIEISEKHFEKLRTVKDAVDLISAKLVSKGK